MYLDKHRLIKGRSHFCIEAYKGWLQESAYQGYCLRVKEGWVKGKHGIVVSRFKEGESV